jgi:hypothetical protein
VCIKSLNRKDKVVDLITPEAERRAKKNEAEKWIKGGNTGVRKKVDF